MSRRGAVVITDRNLRMVRDLSTVGSPAEMRWRNGHDPLSLVAVACEYCGWRQVDHVAMHKHPERLDTALLVLQCAAWYHRCDRPNINIWCVIHDPRFGLLVLKNGERVPVDADAPGAGMSCLPMPYSVCASRRLSPGWALRIESAGELIGIVTSYTFRDAETVVRDYISRKHGIPGDSFGVTITPETDEIVGDCPVCREVTCDGDCPGPVEDPLQDMERWLWGTQLARLRECKHEHVDAGMDWCYDCDNVVMDAHAIAAIQRRDAA